MPSDSDAEQRPWGSYKILSDSHDCKVKRISVKPHGRLSYQYHRKREEFWTFVCGTGKVVLDGVEQEVSAGSVFHVPHGCKHRVENTGTEDLDFVEVQLGTYFGEDDIVRLLDDYGRAPGREGG
jgi:mannose-6-phosphate isomerase